MSASVVTTSWEPEPEEIMFEFWCATTGNKLAKRSEWVDRIEAFEEFTKQVEAALDLRHGWFLELRRPDGSVLARCTVHAEAPPKKK